MKNLEFISKLEQDATEAAIELGGRIAKHLLGAHPNIEMQQAQHGNINATTAVALAGYVAPENLLVDAEGNTEINVFALAFENKVTIVVAYSVSEPPAVIGHFDIDTKEADDAFGLMILCNDLQGIANEAQQIIASDSVPQEAKEDVEEQLRVALQILAITLEGRVTLTAEDIEKEIANLKA